MSTGRPQPYPAGPPPRPPGPGPAAAAAAAVVVVLILLSALAVWLWRDDLFRRPVAGQALAEPGAAAPRSSGPPVALPSPSAADPVAALQQEVAADRTAVDALAGQWIPQVSAKAAGLVTNGRTYDDAAVLADFTATRARFPRALLLRSQDYTSFRRGGFYVTVIGQPFPTPQAANAWCDQQALGADDCFAKRLSHTAGPEGNTLAR